MKKIVGLNQYNEPIEVKILLGKIISVEKIKSNINNLNYIIPGFIEIHTHGAYGFDWNIGTLEEAKKYLNKISLMDGVTSVLGTTVTTKNKIIKKTLSKLSVLINKSINGANFLGWNIEGPFINPDVNGWHPKEDIKKLTIENLNDYLGNHIDKVKIITFAPELLDNLEVINYLKKQKIKLFAGHTNLDLKDLKNINIQCISNFNINKTIKNLENKEELLDYILKSKDIYIEYINNELYNSDEFSKKIFENKPKDKLIIITNSLYVKGLPDGEYSGPNYLIIKKNNETYTSGGELIGSSQSMNIAFKDLIKSGYSFEEAIMATSTNAANLLNLKKGKIKVGYDADIIILDKHYNIKETYVNGKKIRKFNGRKEKWN